MTTTAIVRRHPRWYHPRAIWRSFVIRPRVFAAAAVGIAAYLAFGSLLPAAVREAAAWCLGGLTYLVLAFHMMAKADSKRVETRAARQDDSAVVILILILVALFSSFFAIVGLLTQAKVAADSYKLCYVGLTAATIVISWLVMQVVFTIHYAHLYYAPRNLAEPGLEFPKDTKPDYWDFFYFSSSFGAASQTSDVAISSKDFRRLTTLHAIVAFFFNTMVLALTINLAASMI